ncbi:hypothetical protein F5J12DRAFT_930080 [Pisolithus orientalis]|uniref:uncharacterized protein n=1 Tax=Pisolithus orientalis TaxID=936130 RepID=UPI002224C93E|nr:uncharacterized protein F5J12DRAFT_930080 [Pisolithus orientalis]KAI5988303.1 hypothetical protein F5J12DRAFT_930080 [Pisolithus orientalis]
MSLQSIIQSVVQQYGDASSLSQQQMGPNPHASVSGYTPQHALHASERERWARLSYCSPPVETIMLDISALYEGGTRKGHLHGTHFGNICEGKRDIDARITAPELVTLALTTIIPKVIAFCPDFPWRFQEFIIRDASWVDLSTHPELHWPYFYSSCIQANRKNAKTPVFKTKQFSLYIVIPASQWKEYEEHVEAIISSALDKPAIECGVTQIQSQDVSSSRATMAYELPTPVSRDHSQDSFTTSFANQPLYLGVIAANGSAVGQCREPLFISTTGLSAPGKRSHQHSNSISSPTSLPRKKQLARPLSPDHDHVIKALLSGGSADVDVKKEILENPNKHSFKVDPLSSHPGQLIFDTSSDSLVGAGGFKTA